MFSFLIAPVFGPLLGLLSVWHCNATSTAPRRSSQFLPQHQHFCQCSLEFPPCSSSLQLLLSSSIYNPATMSWSVMVGSRYLNCRDQVLVKYDQLWSEVYNSQHWDYAGWDEDFLGFLSRIFREGAEKKKEKQMMEFPSLRFWLPPPVNDGKYKVILFGIRTMLWANFVKGVFSQNFSIKYSIS